ncbi:MAG: MOSC domain-containing protein [Hyphomicrobium sp.]
MPQAETETGARLATLYRYPVKGLAPEALQRVTLATGETMPFDRAYAIENGPGPFDPDDPKHLPKLHFVMLMRNELLATLRVSFDDATQTLSVAKAGAPTVSGDLRTEAGRAAIEAVIAGTVVKGLRGAPRIIASPGHSFSDVDAKCLHIVNLESVRALEAKMDAKVDPRRFRPNIIVDGWPPWSEFDAIGKTLKIGATILEVFSRTERCAATTVDPETGVRDLKIPSFLSKTYGHTDFGVYARVVGAGPIAVGDAAIISA